MQVALNPMTGSSLDTQEEKHGRSGEATWRRRGGHRPRDRRLEPREAARGGKDPPLEPLQGAQPWDPLDLTCLVSKTGGTQMNICCFEPPVLG